MVFSMECGLVLFHLRNVYHQGFWIGENYSDYLHKFPPGTQITFLDSYHEGDEFKAISKEGFIRQATALWVEERPKHLLKSLNCAEQRNSMRQEREALMGYVNNDFFLRMAQVRGRGQITGYLTDDMGLIETADKAVSDDGEWPEENVTMILFHVDDLFMFGRRWRERNRREPVQQAFPPGLRICFDARSVRRFRGVTGQAAAVFAGTWPAVPHPTALPGGVGSNAPCHEGPAGQTFYYLNASLREDLDMKLEEFRRRADHSTDLQNAEMTIESSQDYYAWRDIFAPPGRKGPRPRRQGDNYERKKRNYHQFKRMPPTGSDKSKEKKV